MSQQHPIDELFRAKLENHAFEPPMQLWENIDKQRNRKKILFRRSRTIPLLLIAGVFLTLAIATLFMMYPFGDNPSPQTSTGMAKGNIPEESVQLPLEQKDNIDAARGQNPKVDALPETKTIQPGDAGQNIKDNQHVSRKNQIIAAKTQQLKTNPGESEVPGTNITLEMAETSGLKATQTDHSDFPGAEGSVINETSVANPTREKSGAAINEQFHSADALKRLAAVNYLPLKNKLLSKEAAGSAGFPKGKTDCPTFTGLPGGIYLDMNASIDLAQRSMIARDPEFESYLLEREKTEIPYFAFSAGLQVTALSEKGYALKTGVDYSQINESFNFDKGEVLIITIIGTDTTWEMKNLKVRANNRYQMVDIPLLAGYEHNFSNFSLSVYGGPFLNVKFGKKGNLIATETMQPVGVTTGEPEKFSVAFRDKLGLGWYTSFGFAYKLEHGTQIRIEPYFRFYPKSFSAADFVIDQRYFLTGIKVGVRKRL